LAHFYKLDSLKLDRSIELFSNNINQEFSLRLKCKFDPNNFRTNESSTSNKQDNYEPTIDDPDETDYLNLSASSTTESISWFKWSPTSGGFTQLKRSEYQIDSFNRFTSNLRFKMLSDLQSLAGVYLCKSNQKQQQQGLIKNLADFNLKSKYNSHFLQKISING
jgi:hypothetical protein